MLITSYLVKWYTVLWTSDLWFVPQSRCFLGILTIKGFGDILLSLVFIFALYYFTRKSVSVFPLPFTWIFEDLSKFIFEPMCVRIFAKYLKDKERSKEEYLHEAMKIYIDLENSHTEKESHLSSFVETSTTTSVLSTRGKTFKQYIKRLEPSFDRFKLTCAYEALYKKIQEFEEISMLVYDSQ